MEIKIPNPANAKMIGNSKKLTASVFASILLVVVTALFHYLGIEGELADKCILGILGINGGFFLTQGTEDIFKKALKAHGEARAVGVGLQIRSKEKPNEAS